MTYLNTTSVKARTYDAIVIGSGASGGWAAKELCERGLHTLVLERGRDVQHIKDYPTASKGPWQFEFRGTVPLDKRVGYQNQRYLREETLHWALKDDEQPFVAEKPFRWFRGYHVGGKSLLWARQTQRWSDLDFEGPARDGFAVDWPIRYKDLEPWYAHVEKFAGIAGDRDGLDVLPDSETQPAFEVSCIEQYFRESIAKHYQDRHLIKARCAHLTAPQAIHLEQGRGKCQHQTMCNRGCNFGAYFSSNASTLPWAMKTGRLTIRPHAVVHSVLYDEQKKRASGVRIIDATSGEAMNFYAKLVFVNASALNSNAILLNSTSNRFPNGLGNDSGLLGKYIAWHNYRGHAHAQHEGFLDKKTEGRSPTHSYIPRFRNVHKQETDFLRGYAIGIGGGRGTWSDTDMIGDQLRTNLLHPEWNLWGVSSWMMGETVPLEKNHVRLHPDLTDKYGIPQLVISCEWSDNDDKMVADYMEQSKEMFEKAGFINISADDSHSPPGSDIHEMGGVRMGHDPKTSLLNQHNQLHQCKNVFVTDGACMTSTGTQNPTLTFMALTARAANYAADQLKKGNL
ncbi:Choline dehydrogenase [Catalinimonas alkaloidigena]|uniref:Choline dehydrogenase n=1 Tax=Catalinimonas alkaloidigena TaxID=1075417 RepID=A0A1G9AY27_9BACT|nr:GMC family oxidoreductase [Catalinimonas alkaloidigena]SDK32123.1 Choline dehydrogenase [Catalinimonas alkaloidigena]